MADEVEVIVEGATPTATETQDAGEPAELGDPGKKALDAERARAKEAERELKALKAEFDEIRKSQMTEQERAIAEAKAAARAEVVGEFGSRIAAAEFRAAAAGRLDDDQVTVLLDSVDLSKFLTDAGEVDADKVRAVIDGITPKAPDPSFVPDMGQGARGSTPALGSDPLLAALKHTVGAR
jgi:hypothetical protein